GGHRVRPDRRRRLVHGGRRAPPGRAHQGPDLRHPVPDRVHHPVHHAAARRRGPHRHAGGRPPGGAGQHDHGGGRGFGRAEQHGGGGGLTAGAAVGPGSPATGHGRAPRSPLAIGPSTIARVTSGIRGGQGAGERRRAAPTGTGGRRGEAAEGGQGGGRRLRHAPVDGRNRG